MNKLTSILAVIAIALSGLSAGFVARSSRAWKTTGPTT